MPQRGDIIRATDLENLVPTRLTELETTVGNHLLDKNNPHGVTKEQVGLGSVQNYGIATQAEAEVGTSSNKYMTPQRTKQAIDALSPVKSVAGKTGTVTISWADINDKPTTFTPATHNHNDLYYTKSETDTKISTGDTNTLNSAKTYADGLSGVRIIDNRTVSPKPTDYTTNRTTFELKTTSAISLNAASGTYAHVFTERAWSDASSGYVRQVAFDGHSNKIFVRYGNQSTDSWSSWEQLETTNGSQDKVNAHANRTDNPHGVTKEQVGLGSVQNYGVATQAEAQAGTATNKYMTPIRTKEAIYAFAEDASKAQEKANTALASAKEYTDTKMSHITTSSFTFGGRFKLEYNDGMDSLDLVVI